LKKYEKTDFLSFLRTFWERVDTEKNVFFEKGVLPPKITKNQYFEICPKNVQFDFFIAFFLEKLKNNYFYDPIFCIFLISREKTDFFWGGTSVRKIQIMAQRHFFELFWEAKI